jgi:hypothetical protein
LVGDEVAKKLGKNLSSPLTEAGLLMEDAETPMIKKGVRWIGARSGQLPPPQA